MTDTSQEAGLYPPDPDGRPGYSRRPQEWDRVTHRLSGMPGAVFERPGSNGVMTVIFEAGLVSRMHASCFAPVTDESGAVLGTGMVARRELMTVVSAFRVREQRHRQVEELARELGIDSVALDTATTAAMSALHSPVALSFDQALTVAGAVLATAGWLRPPF